MHILSRRLRFWPALAVCALASACTGDPAPSASGDPAGTSMVIAIADEPVSVHPLAGYAEHGAAKVFDGLLEHRANLSLRPALAVEPPEPAPDGKSWTARLREGITFSDGTALDAADVVATYRALLDPAYASPVRQRFWMLTGIRQLDARTVRFDLNRPYAAFPQLLVLGIVPSEALAKPGPVTESGPPPAGTGPYRVTEWSPGQRMVLEANKSYFDGPPAITKVTVEFLPDDDARARRMRDGKLDGAALPPALARTFEGADGLRVVAHSAADLHAIALPAGEPVTGDPALRLALNYGVNRKALVDGVLGGKGTEASTPMPEALAEFVEPTAKFPYDVTRALDLLAEAGWLPGADGMRAKAGVPARFTLLYRSGDTLARDLASAFATGAKGIGIQVSAEAADADTLLTRSTKDAVLFGFGNPFDPDLYLYQLLHSSADGRLAANPTIDAALDTGRTATDPAQRATAYRKLQRTYLTAPSMVVLAAPQHTYVLRETWNGYEPVIDAQDPDFTWGAWWNVHKWTPR
ncbi:MAG TPA: ABC transporter substrate-binding protein [Actinophytocola sp.]|uniref:ABC transporter substrate-binding protein n=1 Tax=Actinophytocola sp. TaxID=1872138 RepID=UPI002DDD7431|nr:ABC transporter substrate-binding protein [Actinophytocola sp.]HEV2783984.1 ABC transporter substrate-binding protein [Actinophytocola sp.]